MDHSHESTDSVTRRRGWILPTAVSSLLLVTGIAAWSMQQPPSPVLDTVAEQQPAIGSAESAPTPSPPKVSTEVGGKIGSTDRMVGTWVCNDMFRRRIHVRADGTASMNVKLDFIASLLYGSEMDLELTWTADGDSLVYAAVSGEPKHNVDRLLSDFGRQQVYDVVEFDGDRMLLELTSDKSRHDWRREEP